jgi:hypothetical protein
MLRNVSASLSGMRARVRIMLKTVGGHGGKEKCSDNLKNGLYERYGVLVIVIGFIFSLWFRSGSRRRKGSLDITVQK